LILRSEKALFPQLLGGYGNPRKTEEKKRKE